MNGLEALAATLPPEWKWQAIFLPPEAHEAEWRRWLARAQRAEEDTLLGWWAQRERRAA